jgi:hypothetical protein
LLGIVNRVFGTHTAATRAAKGIGHEMARKTVATRLANKKRAQHLKGSTDTT